MTDVQRHLPVVANEPREVHFVTGVPSPLGQHRERTGVTHSCTADGCSAWFEVERLRGSRAEIVAPGWIKVLPGWRCPEHHSFAMTREAAISRLLSLSAIVAGDRCVGLREVEELDAETAAALRALGVSDDELRA